MLRKCLVVECLEMCKPATELNLLIVMLYLIASARHLCQFHYLTILLYELVISMRFSLVNYHLIEIKKE